MRDTKGFISSLLAAGALVLALATPARARQPEAWTELGGSATGGGISNTPGASQGVVMAADPDGNPVAVWYESGGDYGLNVYLRRWTGADWEELEGSGSAWGLAGPGYNWAYKPSVAVDSTGIIYVAFLKATAGKGNLHVIRWTGDAWEPMPGPGPEGGVNFASGANFAPVLVVDPFDKPWIAWHESLLGLQGKEEVYLRRWDGSSWMEFGGSATGGGVSNTPATTSRFPRFAFDKEGTPFVAWTEIRLAYNTGSDVLLRRWSGAAWVEMGGSATGTGISGPEHVNSDLVAIVVDSSGRAVLLWGSGSDSHNEAFLRRWNGSAWVGLGGSNAGSGISGTSRVKSCNLALDSGENPVVVWSEGLPYQIRIRRWNGSAWQGMDGSDGVNGLGVSLDTYVPVPTICVSRKGDVFVAWNEGPAGDQETYVRRWSNVQVTDLKQFHPQVPSAIPVGGDAGGGIRFRAYVSRPFGNEPIQVQIELRAPGEEFTGEVTAESTFVPSPGFASVTLHNLVLGGWKWRARAVESSGYISPWVDFGDNADFAIDFRSVPAEFGGSGGDSEDDSGGSCGLLGIEGPILLALLLGIRNRRAGIRI